MSGKASLIIVIGFTAILLGMGIFWGSLSARSVDNSVLYYEKAIARNIAVSGANIALSEVMRDSNWASDISGLNFDHGKMTVAVTKVDSTITIKSVGEFKIDANNNVVKHTVRVKLARATKIFAEYAWFIPSVSTGSAPTRPWITGDVVWGGFHSNQFLVISGNPVFHGKVTTLKGIQGTGNPQFLGGYEEGVNVSWDQGMVFPDQRAAAIAGQAAGGTCYFGGSGPAKNVWLLFHGDGTVTYRTAATNAGDDSSKYSAPVTLPLSTMAPTGVIFVDKADVFLSGTLNGEIVVVAEGSSGAGSGNAYLTGDIVYAVDPMIPNGAGGYMPNPACDDMLGIIATNNIMIATSPQSGGKANNVDNPDIHIDAAMFAVKGGVQVQGLGAAPANVPLGSIYLQGSMVAGKEESVAQFNGTTVTAGYNRNVIFDSRFALGPPTWFPKALYYKVMSWLE